MKDYERLRSLYLGIRNVHDLSMRRFNKKTADVGVTSTQFGILRTMPLDGKLTMTELIRRVGCAPSNMTSIIQRMVRDDLVRTTKNPTDQRETWVFLTPKGIEYRDSLEPMYYSFLQECFGSLSEEEQQSLNRLLNQLEKCLTDK